MLFGRRRRLGLALGSGAARGLAHIGVARVLADAGVRPAVITGTSMGAAVGALLAAGRTPAEIEAIATGFDARSLFSLADPAMSRFAVLSGDKVEAFLAAHLPARFEDLELPFACVSTDLRTGRRVVHRAGDLPQAVHASASIPLLFVPVDDDGRALADGCLVDPIPVGLARELGADPVIAVDVCGDGALPPDLSLGPSDEGVVRTLVSAVRDSTGRAKRPSYFEVAATALAIMERGLARASLESADIVIRPAVGGYDGYEFLSAAEIIGHGAEAAACGLDEIRRLLHIKR